MEACFGTKSTTHRPFSWTAICLAALTMIRFGGGSTSLAAEMKGNPAQTQKDLLTAKYSKDFLLGKMLPREAWKPFPPAADRKAWEALEQYPLNRERKAYVIGQAEVLLGQPWPALSATLYMEYARTGNRSRYQAPYFLRRHNLGALVLAECMEGRGRFLDEIANGVWAICEESTWCIPAHATRLNGDVLHRLDIEGLDLFACETGMALAQTHYLLGRELEAFSPALGERIRREVRRRILDPYVAGDNFGRAGWVEGRNNWSPWCASNVLGAAMYLEQDPQRLADITLRLMRVVDRFINNYGEDGGCDEGPGYWNEAAGAMLVFLELLHSRTGGAIDIYAHPKIAAMGRFITHAHLAGPWFANFSDADPQANPNPGKVYRFGERVNSEAMKNLALLTMRGWKPQAPVAPPVRIPTGSRALLGPLMELFWIPPDATPTGLIYEDQVWLPDLQALFARETANSETGLALAAKGGHNAESHNHNDVGHFILFLDGQPGIIDVGRETYTRKTFSSERYDLWFARGLGHNAPVVNGVEQREGREYQATNVHFQVKDFGPHLAMNLERAYPGEAGLKSLRREFEFRRGPDPSVRVRDTFELARAPSKILIPMYAALPVKQVRPGRLSIGCRPRPLLLDYEPETMTATVQVVVLEDEELREGWGERLYRIAFEFETAKPAGAYTFEFRPAPDKPARPGM